jgi:O-antigen ligase
MIRPFKYPHVSKQISYFAVCIFIVIFPILEGASNEFFAVGTVYLGAIVAFTWIFETLAKGFKFHREYALVLCFFMWNLMTLLWASDLSAAQERATSLAMVILFYFMVCDLAENSAASQGLLAAYTIGVFFLGVTCLYNIKQGITYENLVGRYSAIGTDPNNFGIMIASTLPGIFYFGARKGLFGRLIFYGLAILAAALAVSTASRAATLAVFLFISLYLALNLSKSNAKFMIPLLVLVGIVTMIGYEAFVPGDALHRIELTLQRQSEEDRLTIWGIAIDMGLQHLAGGVGAGNFLSQTGEFQAHNTFLGSFAELGLPGFILYSAIWIIHLGNVLKLNPYKINLRKAIFISLAIIFIAALTLNWEFRKPLYFFLALAAAYRIQSRVPPQTAPIITQSLITLPESPIYARSINQL